MTWLRVLIFGPNIASCEEEVIPAMTRTLNVFYNWFVTTLCYYGLTFMATDLTGNFFSDYSLLIFVEIPAHFYCILALDRIGRKRILAFSLMLSGVCCIVAAFVDHISWLQVREEGDPRL